MSGCLDKDHYSAISKDMASGDLPESSVRSKERRLSNIRPPDNRDSIIDKYEGCLKMKESGFRKFRSVVERAYEYWNELGLKLGDRVLQERADYYLRLFAEDLDTMLQEEAKMVEKYQTAVEGVAAKITHLTRLLGRKDIEEEDLQLPEGYGLMQLLDRLNEIHRELAKEKEEKTADFRKLLEEEEILAKRLGMPQVEVDHEILPTPETLKTVAGSISLMKAELIKRERKLKQLQEDLARLYESVERQPKPGSIGYDILHNKELVLSSKNLKSGDELKESLELDEQKLKKEADFIRNEIQVLSDRLGLGEDGKKFLMAHASHSSCDRHALENERARLEILKQSNMEKIINKVREEIREMWKNLYYGPRIQGKFVDIHSDDFSEDLLNRHELELERLKEECQQKARILALIPKRRKLFNRMLELDQLEGDPERFKNRGGQLLREEHERNRINKELPKLENEILQLCEEWEEASGPFLYEDIPFKERVATEWEERIMLKENRGKKTEQVDQALPKKGQGMASTLSAGSKRKACLTPRGVSPSKVKRVLQAQSAQAVMLHTPGRSEKKHTLPQAKLKMTEAEELGSIATYDQFAVHKETIDKVPNSLPNRSDIEIEIYGMEGIPEDDLLEHERLKTGKTGPPENSRDEEEPQPKKVKTNVPQNPPLPNGMMPMGMPMMGPMGPMMGPMPPMPGVPPYMGHGMPVGPSIPQNTSAGVPGTSAPPKPLFPSAAAAAAAVSSGMSGSPSTASPGKATFPAYRDMKSGASVMAGSPSVGKIQTAGASMKIMHPEDDISLEEMRARLPKYAVKLIPAPPQMSCVISAPPMPLSTGMMNPVMSMAMRTPITSPVTIAAPPLPAGLFPMRGPPVAMHGMHMPGMPFPAGPAFPVMGNMMAPMFPARFR
ncbi:unnamed protein product [Darwinula stevensoni]|uniref:Uncharacterized protein n=1 Tax=Darwinula stevensoni TaxID=69355 RepID=A0A7R8X587_9CRUS|nr:unnamed protein product [Darwinula stevensoni]CAG0879847.1 unnamed protein product [Darwinula stevensoni]